MQELVTGILQLGYVEAESKGICVEVPADSRGDVTRDFNRTLAEEAKGKLAAVQPELIRYASVVGSHANQAFRAFALGAEHPDERVTVAGVLNLDRLASLDPQWAKAVKEGVMWTIVSHDVQSTFPDFCRLVQAAGNAAGQIAKPEDDPRLSRLVDLYIPRNIHF